ncbi:MAG: response regulator [Bdellovibrionia bacterium]
MKRFAEKRILIADDETVVREALAEELADEGATTFQAANAFEALSILKVNPVDLVISDIRMQGGDGITLLEKIRKTDAFHPPLIFMTGFTDLTVQEAYRKGAEAVVTKPFSLEVIKNRVLHFLIPQKDRYGKKCGHNSLFQVQQSFLSFQDALKQKKLRLGRGGFFLEGNYSLQVNETLQFKISFTLEKPALLEGEGIVRWAGALKDDSVGIGIEITYLSDQCRGSFIQYWANIKEKDYIPMGIY